MNETGTAGIATRCWLAAGAAFVLATAIHAQPSSDGTADVSTAARVDELFAEWSRADSPGCAVGVSRHGVTVHERGYGLANLETRLPITPDTAFHVASISKQFTAMSILRLVERGKLSLDDDVRRYVPDWSVHDNRVTIRHLLTHTSGVRDAFLLGGLLPRRDEGDVNESIVRRLARQRGLNFAPGSEFQYSNSAYALLGQIVKRVSGESLRAFADANIFRPLGMTRTHVHDDPAFDAPNRARGYRRDAGVYRIAPHADFGHLVGTTGLVTTVGDMLRWQQNLDETRVGDKELVASMQRPTTLTTGETSAYGFGLELGEDRGLRTVSHGGGDPGFAAYVIRYPTQGLTVAVFCNAEDVNARVGALARAVAGVYLPEAPHAARRSTPPPATVSLTAAQLNGKTGLYRDVSRDTWGALVRMIVREGKLTAILGSGDSIALTPVGAHRFVIPGLPVTVEFVPGTGNRPHEMHVVTDGAKREILQRLPPFTARSEDLRALSGDYTNDEIDVTYTISARQRALVLKIPERPEVVLTPIARDTFEGFNVIRFTRGTRGRVTGFTFHSDGVRSLRFERVQRSRP